MSVDLIIHAGTKFALHQWLDARGLGENAQDTDATSPTFGDYFYAHAVGQFYYWNHPSGLIPGYTGFFALLKLEAIPEALTDWTTASTASSILQGGLAGVGGEGVTILDPEDLRSTLTAAGVPLWDGILGVGNTWSDPALWAFSNVMTGDQREFEGQTYTSLIDFNVWSPTQYPQGWEVAETAPAVAPWVQPTGAADAYAIGDEVTHENAQDGGNVWLFRSKIPANTTEPGTDGTPPRWWEPIQRV